MKKVALSLIAFLTCQFLLAHDFALTLSNGQQLYFNITDTAKCQLELTYKGSIKDSKVGYVGKLSVPSTIKYKNKVYSVTSIGKKAFADNTKLTELVLPSGLTTIGDFAFDGCTALERVIMPGNKVKFGTGTFFRCTAVKALSLGSDWTEVNMKMFRWCSELKEIDIPVKMVSVQNLKSLKGLEKITVDANNQLYMAIDGVLYSKKDSSLLCCPRDYKGVLNIPEGVENVRWGALADCPNLTEVVFPTTLKTLSYRELARISKLERIIMKGETPIMTAENNGVQKFILTVPNQDVCLIVAKKALKAYTKALAQEVGNYSEIKENLPSGMNKQRAVIPYEVKTDDILNVANVYGTKDFSTLKDVKPKKKTKK